MPRIDEATLMRLLPLPKSALKPRNWPFGRALIYFVLLSPEELFHGCISAFILRCTYLFCRNFLDMLRCEATDIPRVRYIRALPLAPRYAARIEFYYHYASNGRREDDYFAGRQRFYAHNAGDCFIREIEKR